MGSKTAAFRAIHSKDEAAAKAVYSLDSSATKDLPTFPNGILKQFFLQWTASPYASSRALQKLSESLSPQVNLGSANGLKVGRVGTEVVDMVGPVGVLLMEDDMVAGPLTVASVFVRGLSVALVEGEARGTAVRVGEGVTVAVIAVVAVDIDVDCEETAELELVHCPRRVGKQFRHFLPAFTQPGTVPTIARSVTANHHLVNHSLCKVLRMR